MHTGSHQRRLATNRWPDAVRRCPLACNRRRLASDRQFRSNRRRFGGQHRPQVCVGNDLRRNTRTPGASERTVPSPRPEDQDGAWSPGPWHTWGMGPRPTGSTPEAIRQAPLVLRWGTTWGVRVEAPGGGGGSTPALHEGEGGLSSTGGPVGWPVGASGATTHLVVLRGGGGGAWGSEADPRRNAELLHVGTRGDQHKNAERKSARQWPKRP